MTGQSEPLFDAGPDEEGLDGDDAFDDLLAGGTAGGAAPAAPPRWEALDEAARATAMAELTEWVTWLGDRYEVEDVPRCWPDHGGAVEELAALRAAWLAAYDELAAPTDALAWHERLEPALGRISGRWCRGCSSSGHRERYRRGS